MSALVFIFVGLLAVLLGVVLLVMITPLRLELLLTKDDALRFCAALRPLGRFGPRIELTDRHREKPKEKPVTKRKKKTPVVQRIRERGVHEVMNAATRLVSDIIHCVRVEKAVLDVTFGFDDPGDTGQAYGMLAPLIYTSRASDRMRVAIVPEFDRATLQGRVALDLSLIPAMLVPPVTRFGWAIWGPVR
ncbi:MAG: DUF2953 domain-containing protein [Rhodobacteraceae bacterium]|nr:DUF2953 domain-containing protein [Paracoccaceae bacterium]NNK68725.1 DUF2953 domain-containing protein [Paracoccaceae bacterium]